MTIDHTRSALAALLFLGSSVGCPSVESPNEANDTGGASTDTTGPAGPTGDPDTTTGGLQTSSGDRGSEDTSADSSSGEPGSELEQACQATCDVTEMCSPESLPDDCVEFCLNELPETDDPECTAQLVELYNCYGSSTCEELMGNPCSEQSDVVDQICGTCFIDATITDGLCEYQALCFELDQRMNCDPMGCTCIDDGIEVGSCGPIDACDDLLEISAYAMECCGFEPPEGLG